MQGPAGLTNSFASRKPSASQDSRSGCFFKNVSATRLTDLGRTPESHKVDHLAGTEQNGRVLVFLTVLTIQLLRMQVDPLLAMSKPYERSFFPLT